MDNSIPVVIKHSLLPDPFGMITVGRNWAVGSDYRYGFNGQEYVNEIYSNTTAMDFGARIYDTRLGRFFSTDPFEAKYCWLSPYNFASNCPIFYLDFEGLGINGGFSVENNSSQPVILVGNGLKISYYIPRIGKAYQSEYTGTNLNAQGDLLNTFLVLEPNQRFEVVVTKVTTKNNDGSYVVTSTYSGQIIDMSDGTLVADVQIYDIDGLDLTPSQSVTTPSGDKLTEANALNQGDGEDWVQFDSDESGKADDRIDVKFNSGPLNALISELNGPPNSTPDVKIVISGTSSLRIDVQGSAPANTPTIKYPEIKQN